MDESGRRCADRDGCRKAAMRSPGVTVSKTVLCKQYGSDVIE
jgi:hypothetical protein